MLLNRWVRLSGPIARTMSTLEKPAIRPAASLIIAAPLPLESQEKGSNYHILMLKRNAKSSFINAHVYPGGVVDKADNSSFWDTISTAEKEKHILTNKICAIRETFEESGLLLSEPPAHTIKDLDINVWRHKVHQDASEFEIMCKQYNIRPAVESLIPFSNWITPTMEKKRYDTLFFITVLDQFKTQTEHDQHYHLVAADGKETVLFEWLKPEEGIQLQKEKKILTIPPQWYSLTLFSQIPDYKLLAEKAGFGSFRSKDHVVAILPQAQSTEEDSQEAKEGYHMFLAYPGDETYQSNRYISEKGNQHRLYIRGRMEEFKLSRNVDVATIIKNNASL